MRSLITAVCFFFVIALVATCSVDRLDQCRSGMVFPIVEREKWGAVNVDGDLVIPVQYDWLYFNRFSTGLVLAELDSFKMIISTEGKVLKDQIPYNFEVIIKCDSVVILSDEKVIYELFANNDLLKSPDRSLECDCKLGEPGAIEVDTYLFNSEYYCGVAFVIGDDYWGYVNSDSEKIWTVENLPAKEFFHVQYSMRQVQKLKFERIIIDAFEVQHLIKDLNSCKNIDFTFPHFERREIRM